MTKFFILKPIGLALRQKKIICLSAILCMATTMQLSAKDLKEVLNYSTNLSIDIRGKVLDEKGIGIPGVSIKIKNTEKTTTTDNDGNFILKGLNDDAILIVSYVGYTTQEAKVTSGNMLIKLAPQLQNLDEVVVVGYGTAKKSDLTGAVGTVKAEALQERPASSLNQSLSGRVSGVNVSSNSGRPGGRANIRIRGVSSLSVSNNPLLCNRRGYIECCRFAKWQYPY
ncbi:carboxypeptidase-like regulatory domain-containing protein [Pedobacter sp. NJ-S-72]